MKTTTPMAEAKLSLARFRSRWFAALQLLCTLCWTLHPMPHVHTDEPEELWNTWSGYWYIDGIEQWVEGQYPDWHGWLDTDSDGLPDWADPYPSDNSNNTTWSSSGFWYVDYMDQWFDSYPYATTNPVDADQNGLPDWYDHNYPIDGTNTPWSTYGGYWSSQGVEDWTMLGIYPGNHVWIDSDGDWLADDVDPYPWDSDNGSFVSLNYYSGSWYINGVEQYLSGGTEDWSDSDGDYLPDSVDPYPYDPTNNSTWWEGIGIWIDGEYREYESRWMATSNVFDSDGDGLPDFIDPYPDSASNIYVELQYWNEWRWINGEEIQLGGYYTNWQDTDLDGIPSPIDPYPNDPYNNTEWHEILEAQSPDTDGDGIPDSVEAYYGLNRFDDSDANADIDGDGLPNLWEYQYSFSLRDVFTAIEDPDNDTLTNLEEYLHGTDPWLADTDGDGFDDADEIAAGSHPRQSGSTPANPGSYGTGSSIIDSDGDGLSDFYEQQTGTDPTKEDSDGDGFADGFENQNGTDPLIASDIPQPKITLQVRYKSVYTDGIAPHLVDGDPFHPDSITSGYASIQWGTPVDGGHWFGPIQYSYQEPGPDLRTYMNDPDFQYLWAPGAPRDYSYSAIGSVMENLPWGEEEQGWNEAPSAEATFFGDTVLSSARYAQYRLYVEYPAGYPQDKIQTDISRSYLELTQKREVATAQWELAETNPMQTRTLVANEQTNSMGSQGTIVYVSEVKTLELTGGDGEEWKINLLPVEVKVVNRDDPAKTWTTGPVTFGPLAYTSPTISEVSDVKNGDLISWSVPGLTGGSFQWWATGPSGSLKDAPSSVTGNEWKLEDPLDWLPGKWRIHCRYTPSGGAATEFDFEQNLGYRSPDITVIGWIDGAQIVLPSGADKPLLRTWPSGTTPDWFSVETWMGSLPTRLTFLGQVAAGDVYTIPITPDPVRKYVNAWLIKDTPNDAPPASFLEGWNGYPGRFMVDEDGLTDFRNDSTKFRSFHRFQARFELDDSGKIKGSPHFIKSDTNVGVTPTDWLGWFPPDPRGETGPHDREINSTGVAIQFNPKNGKTHSAKLADDFEQYTQGRIAWEGAFLSKRLNNLNVPWIWSIIEFGAAHAKAGTTAVPEHEIFPVYHVYYNGKRLDTLTNSISEAKMEEFIQLGAPIAP